ncbi:MAG: DUF2232 domain-containing protein [Rhodospirillales bacterium]
MPKDTLIALGAGVLAALAATAFLSRAPGALMLVYFADLPLFMAGFAFGPQAAAIGGAAGFMTAGLIGGGLAAGVFGIMQALPVWLVVRQLLLQRPAAVAGSAEPDGQIEWYPIGDTLCWLTFFAAAMLVVMTLTSLTGDQGLSVLVSTNLDEILKGLAPHWDEEHRASMVAVIVPMLPGAIGVSWLVMTIVNATLAHGILTRLKKILRPSPAYAALDLPQWISWPLVLSALLALLGSGEMEYTGRNLAMILVVPFFFLGLAVVHTWARRVTYSGMVLAAFYLVLVLSGWATIVVAGIGMAELWVGLRHRMDGPADVND